MIWQEELKNSVHSAKELSKYMQISDMKKLEEILERFPMAITPYYLSLINFEDENDPILRMAAPSISETDMSGTFDTSGEHSNTVLPGLQHKYAETVLMLSTSACAMYCRHCFRKRLVGGASDEVGENFEAMRDYITSHKEISNVLVSGGDSLLNSNERLRYILKMLAGIEHLDFIRIGSRVPVVLPSRIYEDNELLDLLGEINLKKKIYFVTQFNHSREITAQSKLAVKKLDNIGIPILNQAVLLKGVNAQKDILGALLKDITSIGVKPYYVFQCRPVKGVKAHFQIPLRQGFEIVEGAKAMQNGLGKSFKYCMSHVSGKMEILGPINDREMLFKYHEAKDRTKLGTFHVKEIDENQAWLDDTE